MATSRDTLFEKTLSGAFWNAGVTFERTNPTPLEKYSVFKTKADADAYALTNVVAYPGQQVAVVGVDSTTLYYIDTNGTLVELGTSSGTGDVSRDLAALSARYNTFLSDEFGPLSTRVQTLSDNISADIQALSADLSAEISSALTAANAYTDAVSAALSSDYVEKIGALSDRLSSAWHFVGVVDELPTDVSTYKNGDILVVQEKDGKGKVINTLEYAFDGTKFVQLGVDKSVYATQAGLEAAIAGLSATVSAEIDADVEALSTSLSNETKAEIAALSTALSNDINALSTALSTEISNINSASTKAVADLSVALSNDIDALSTALSTEISALDVKTAKANSDLSVALSNDIIKLSSDLSTEISALDDAATKKVEKLSTDLSTDIDALSVALSTEISALDIKSAKANADLSTALSNDIVSLSTALSTEISALDDAAAKKVEDLSVALSNDIDTLSTNLSTEISALDAKATKANADLSTALSNDINALSTALSTEISALDDAATKKVEKLSADLSADIGALSTALSNDINALSTALSTEISALDSAAAKKVEDLSVALSNDIITLSTNLSNEIIALSDALSADLGAEIQRATGVENGLSTTLCAVSSDYLKASEFSAISNDIGLSAATADNQVVTKKDIADLAGAMHFKGATTADLSTGSKVIPTDVYGEGEGATTPKAGDIVINITSSTEYVWVGSGDDAHWVELGNEALYATKASLDAEISARKDNDSYLSGQIDGVSATVYTLSATTIPAIALSVDNLSTFAEAEAEARVAADDYLSNAISSKIYAGVNGETLSAVDSLSVVKIDADTYHQMVVAGTVNDQTIYVVSSDVINAYGEKIVNVAKPTLSSDAATKNYVDTAVGSLGENALTGVTLNDLNFKVANNVATLSVDVINCGGADA